MTSASPPSVAVVGAGPAGLMAAEVLARGGAKVTLYDQMPSPGRKFLLAGRGGLNLTHSEEFATFLSRYRALPPYLHQALAAFPPDRLRAWCHELGEETFIGTSGRVFPKSFKASPLLRAWLRRLASQGVVFVPRHAWTGFAEDGSPRFATSSGPVAVEAAATVLALGGASWPHLGSDGRWIAMLAAMGIQTHPLQPANCGFIVGWSDTFRLRFEGQPLKNIAVRFAGQELRGDLMITRSGLEGGIIYALSAVLREAILREGQAQIAIALRADLSRDQIEQKLSTPRGKQSLPNFLRKTLKLSPAAIGLLQEAGRAHGHVPATMDAAELAELIKGIPLRLTGMASVNRAISTAGGVKFDEIDQNFMLVRRPGVFVAGEMLDWEAPTGGYLLQACFATGFAAAQGALAWLAGDDAKVRSVS